MTVTVPSGVTLPVTRDLTRAVTGLSLAGVTFSPLLLFASSEQGAWYDPSDLSSMFQDAAGSTPVTAVEQVVGRILDKSGRGNHATQATTAAKPVLSALLNRIRYTEDFSNAIWALVGTATKTTSGITDPLGGTTACRVGLPDATATFRNTGLTIPANAQGVVTVWMRANVAGTVWIAGNSGGVFPGVAVAITTSWALYTITGSGLGAEGQIYFGRRTSGGTCTEFDMWHPHVEYGLLAHSYQRVGAAFTDYDAVGFPHYLRHDGVDDGMVSSAIDFSATDKMSVFAGILKTSDALGMPLELSADSNANAGAFYLSSGLDAITGFTSLSRGAAALVAGQSATFVTAGASASVLTIAHDIVGDLSSLKCNRVAGTDGVLDKGTGNWGAAYPLYIGRRGGASLPFPGYIYGLIVRGVASTAPQIASTEAYLATKIGITLP